MKQISLKKLTIVLLIAAVIAVGGWASYRYYIHAQLQGIVFFDWEKTEDSSVATLTVENTTFHIPKNYFVNRSSRKSGRVDGFILEVLLPDLEPYSEQNAGEFAKLGWNRRLDILVQARHNSPLTDGQYENVMRGEWYV